MPGPIIQNFSVPAGDNVDIEFDVGPDLDATLTNSQIYWQVFAQSNGLPTGEPLFRKKLTDGIDIYDPDQLKFTVSIDRADTLDLLRNYYHEARIVDESNNHVTVTQGIMTVTDARNVEDVTA